MSNKEVTAVTLRSAAVNFSRPLPSPSLPHPAADLLPSYSSAHLPILATTMILHSKLPDLTANGELASSTPVSSASELGNSFTRDEAGKENGATDVSNTQQTSQPSACTNLTTVLVTDNIPRPDSTAQAPSIDSMAENTAELGKDKPIMNFRPHLWKHLDTTDSSLKLDLFWPVKVGDEDDGVHTSVPKDEDEDIIVEDVCLPIEGFKPILCFRNLCVLQITGMMRSYQSPVWQVVWSNPRLVILELEMALEPLFNEDCKHPNRIIDEEWMVFPVMEASSSNLSVDSMASKEVGSEGVEKSYLGCDGIGLLDEKFGDGEYLDSVSITNAQVAAADAGTLDASNLRYLPVRMLSLQNFVVDGIAFKRWFSPTKIARITFKSGCIDAGFYLPNDMKHTIIKIPEKPVPLTDTASTIRRAPAVPGLQLVELKKGKVVASADVVKAKAALTRPATPIKTTPTKSSPLDRVKSAIKGFGRGKENKAVATAAKQDGERAKNGADAESFLLVDEAVEDTTGETVLPVRSVGGDEAFTKAEIEEARWGKKNV